MRPLFQLLFLLLLACRAGAQSSAFHECVYIVKPDGMDSIYTPTGHRVYTTSSGGVTAGGADPCFPAPNYKVGWGSPGTYKFIFTKPVYGFHVLFAGLNETENLDVRVNGALHPILPAEVISYTSCWNSGTGPSVLAGGKMWGPATGDPVDYNGGEFEIRSCEPIDTIEIGSNGAVAGVNFTICFDRVRGDSCLSAYAVPDTILCAGDSVKLKHMGAVSGYTFYWYGPSGYLSALDSPTRTSLSSLDSGVYGVVRTKIGSSTADTAKVTIHVKPSPALTLGVTSPICYGQVFTVNLTAGPTVPGRTYLWSGPGGFNSAIQNPTITPLTDADTGTYTVDVDYNGCKRSAKVHVGYTPVPPVPTLTGVTHYCTGQPFVPFTFSGQPGATFLWYTVATGGTGNATAPTVSTAAAGVFTHYVSQTVAGCEGGRASITVTVVATPTAPAITGTNSYCQYDTYVPPIATGTGVLWYGASVGGVGSGTPPVINTSVPGTSTIYASQTVDGCESPRASFIITVKPKPSAPIVVNNPGMYCPGQPFVPFTVVSGVGITWYTSATGGTGSPTAPVLSTSTPGIQWVWASQSIGGCESARAAAKIEVADSVKADFKYVVKWGCKADTVVFENTSKQTTVYYWVFGDGFTSHLKEPTHVYRVQKIDTVKLYASVATCADSITQYIDLRHPLKSKFEMDTNIVCQGSLVKFEDSGSIATGMKYWWEYGDNILHPPVTTNTTAHTYQIAGVYRPYLVVSDFIPCYDTMYQTLYVDSISPIHVALTDTVECVGTHVTMTGDYSGIGSTGITWDLGNGDSVQNQNPLTYGYDKEGWYTITGRAYYRVCPDAWATRKIAVVPQPRIDLGAPEVPICKGGTAIEIRDIVNQNNPLATWLWSTGETTPYIVVKEPGVYSTTVKLNGCKTSATVTVKNDCYMNIPNAFTPNEDGSNDYFFPHQYLSSGLIVFKMSIYNRWGQLVFETNALNGRGWDGKLNGIPQPEGVYIYTIEGRFKDGQIEHHEGNVTLLR